MKAWIFIDMCWLLHPCFARTTNSVEAGPESKADLRRMDDMATCAGWDCQPSKNMKAKYGTRLGATESFCDLPVFDSAKIPKDVESDPEWRFKPFIIRKGSQLRKEGFAKEHLLQNARKNNMNTSYGYSWTIVQQDGIAKQEVPFDKFIADHMHSEQYDGKTLMERPYVFHSFSPLFGISGTEFDIPHLMRSWQFGKRSASPILLIGAALSGVGFHSHSAAFQMTAYGYKRWLLYPPDTSPPGGAIAGDWPIYDWMEQVYPSLKGNAKPLECIQEPDDLMWIPESWYHATLNLGDTVAVSILKKDFQSERSISQQKAAVLDHGRERLIACRNALTLQPDNADAKVALAIEFALTGQLPQAEKLLNGVLKADPFHMAAMVTLAEIMEKKLLAKFPKAKKQLEDTLKAFRPSLHVNPRNLAANRLLSRYYELMGDQTQLEKVDRRMDFLEDLGITKPALFENAEETEPSTDL